MDSVENTKQTKPKKREKPKDKSKDKDKSDLFINLHNFNDYFRKNGITMNHDAFPILEETSAKFLEDAIMKIKTGQVVLPKFY